MNEWIVAVTFCEGLHTLTYLISLGFFYVLKAPGIVLVTLSGGFLPFKFFSLFFFLLLLRKSGGLNDKKMNSHYLYHWNTTRRDSWERGK